MSGTPIWSATQVDSRSPLLGGGGEWSTRLLPAHLIGPDLVNLHPVGEVVADWVVGCGRESRNPAGDDVGALDVPIQVLADDADSLLPRVSHSPCPLAAGPVVLDDVAHDRFSVSEVCPAPGSLGRYLEYRSPRVKTLHV